MGKGKLMFKVVHEKKYFPLKKTSIFSKETLYVKANDDISFEIFEGETLGLVGESGCGKSTLGRVMIQLYDATEGDIFYYGRTLEELTPKYYRRDIVKYVERCKEYDEVTAKKKELLLQADTLANDSREKILTLEKAEKYRKKGKKISAINTKLVGGLVLYHDYEKVQEILSNQFNLGVELHKIREYLNLEEVSEDSENAIKAKEQISQLEQKINEGKEVLNHLHDQVRHLPNYEKLESRHEIGINLSRLTEEEMRLIRCDVQIIFQDPYSSLNPRLTVGQLISEGINAHKDVLGIKEEEKEQYILNVMEQCGLQGYMIHRYPHQFSGGQRQRIGIARALAVKPKFIVCDEAVSALDVSIQAQVINLLDDLSKQRSLTYLFISHDLSVIRHISDRIGVMYLGQIVELADSEEIYNNPQHPYTKSLLSAVPTIDEVQQRRILLEGDIPSNVMPPSGCKFRTRCPIACDFCAEKVPEYREVEPQHFVACHFYEKTKDL